MLDQRAIKMMGNKLQKWIEERHGDDRLMMDILQDYGVVSDNCVNVEEVGNDKEAMLWLAKNIEHLGKKRV